jgi:hypothetical protein
MTEVLSTEEWFARLSAMRRAMIDSIHENEADGLLHSTADKYADPAHFVYELLQNAEDQGATSAMFVLRSDRLTFFHNGSDFSRQDVESITNVGNSRKPQQANKIGRFGLGFKSVFTITERPQIGTRLSERPFAFAIEDYMVPVALPPSQIAERHTQFSFPFMCGKELGLHATILEKLRVLGADTLLFLDHLKSIHWKVDDEEVTLRCQREEKGRLCHLIEEKSKLGAAAATIHLDYRVYAKQVEIAGADRPLTVRLAFRTENGHIIPEPGLCTANVYFPTKEKTGLKFRLHAPFLLNDSRANIKENNSVNMQLIRTCAELLTQVLIDLRDRGLLSVEALDCLPLREEDFPDKEDFFATAEAAPFRPLFEAVRDAFRTQALLPTASGSSVPFVKTSHARISESRPLRQLFAEHQLTALEGQSSKNPVCWVSEKIGKNVTRELWEYLTKTLSVEEIDGDKMARKVDGPFLSSQSDTWMISFYEFLNDLPALWRARTTTQAAGPLRTKPIIRTSPKARNDVVLSSSNQVAPFASDGVTPNVYLSNGQQGNFRAVAPTLTASEDARRFLINLGLKEPDIAEYVLTSILPKYTTSAGKENLPPSEYSQDLYLIAQALGTDERSDRNRLEGGLLGAAFVHAISGDGTLGWQRPRSVYTATPELRVWFEGNSAIWFPDEELVNHPQWVTISGFLNRMRNVMPEALRVKARGSGNDSHVSLVDKHGQHERGLNRFDPNATIDGLDYALSHMTMAKAQILWRLLLGHVEAISGIVERSSYAGFSNPTRRECLSELGESVRTHLWLPVAGSSEVGPFYQPNALSLTQLPDEFSTSVNAKELSIKLGMSHPAEEEMAEKVGIPADALAAFIRAYKRDPMIVNQFALHPAPVELPSPKVLDPERRTAKIMAQALEAPQATFERKTRSVRVAISGFHADKRAYLRYFYETEEGHMVCQICRRLMPFSLDDGTDYFKAVACFKHFVTEHIQNHIALCPVCAAKYQHANSLDDTVWQQTIHSAENLLLTITLAREEVTIQFTEPHLLDLKAILKAANQRTSVN